MYFWRIEGLKRELADPGLSEGDAIPYLIWTGILFSIAVGIPYAEANRWDLLSTTIGIPIGVAGTLRAYRMNGAAGGQAFLLRYTVIGWVVGIRVLVLWGVPSGVGLAIVESMIYTTVPPDSTPGLVFFGTTIAVAYYWRLGFHIRDVATRAQPA